MRTFPPDDENIVLVELMLGSSRSIADEHELYFFRSEVPDIPTIPVGAGVGHPFAVSLSSAALQEALWRSYIRRRIPALSIKRKLAAGEDSEESDDAESCAPDAGKASPQLGKYRKRRRTKRKEREEAPGDEETKRSRLEELLATTEETLPPLPPLDPEIDALISVVLPGLEDALTADAWMFDDDDDFEFELPKLPKAGPSGGDATVDAWLGSEEAENLGEALDVVAGSWKPSTPPSTSEPSGAEPAETGKGEGPSDAATSEDSSGSEAIPSSETPRSDHSEQAVQRSDEVSSQPTAADAATAATQETAEDSFRTRSQDVPLLLADCLNLLTLPYLSTDEFDLLLGYTERLAGYAAGMMPVNCTGRSAVGVFGRIFIVVDTLFCSAEVLGQSAMKNVWWPKVLRHIEGAWDGQMQTTGAISVPDWKARVLNALFVALDHYRVGQRPPLHLVIGLKFALFVSPVSTGFQNPKWDPWRKAAAEWLVSMKEESQASGQSSQESTGGQ
ncbi:uncharacterized protein EMH_0085110 [Eimeria mitis]|uniref:Uncharacterized protein n=1 Tax=Eimeria mitis TaxID=44415 RepID=U6KLW0_9EIME|nr:uncharacterized protein EMH_0085110 [Eimeria mitis]CDJ36428.1 hypothetical protein EMH_0085110 [Eimeria mitis]